MSRPLSVYVHVPFCTIKCGYCDFNAYAGMHALAEPYRNAVLSEVGTWADVLAGRPIVSVFFGGGTPSEVPAAHLAAMLDTIRQHGMLANEAEVSVEANPGTIDRAGLEALREAGITRLSIGAQSFDADELRFLDRIHSAEATRAIVQQARNTGFDSLSLDLIYGLPGQDVPKWEQNLSEALELEPDHLSLYALTIEEGTPLGMRVDRGEVATPDPDVVADQYLLTSERLAAAGFEHYEISSWARPGHRSRHNVAYWTDGDYLGIGAGAHGYLDGCRYSNVAHPRAYIARSSATDGEQVAGRPRPFVAGAEPPDVRTAMFDWLQLRLRLLDGFEPGAFAERFGVPLGEVAGPVLQRARQGGLIEPHGPVRLTHRGMLLHGGICGWLWERLESLPGEQLATAIAG